MTWLFGFGLGGAGALIGLVAYLFGPRFAIYVAFGLALLFVSWRTVVSYDVEAALAQTRTDLKTANAAFDDFRAASNEAAKTAANRILEIEAARADVEADLFRARQDTQAALDAAQNRIAAHVPENPRCDYNGRVLGELRDGWARAQKR